MKPSIEVNNISKKYIIGSNQEDRLRYSLGTLFSKKTDKEVWALKNISFKVDKGEVVGIIGKNGAGKSTLLKVLSRITKPTSGSARLYGRVASLLEVGTGFHEELTGRENIYFNANLLGLSRFEVSKRLDEIISFSGVEDYIDTPVKFYSSGMYVRLAFAVAAHLDPDILLIDEVLAVGDIDFQKKCLKKMNSVAREGKTVLFISHNMNLVTNLCNYVYALNKTILGRYETNSLNWNSIFNTSNDRGKEEGLSVWLPDNNIESLGNIELFIELEKPIDTDYIIRVEMIKSHTNELIHIINSKFDNMIFDKRNNKFKIKLFDVPLRSGLYHFNVELKSLYGKIIRSIHHSPEFIITNRRSNIEPRDKRGIVIKNEVSSI